MKDDAVHICTCFDENIIDPVLVLIQSILDNRKKDTRIDFYAITTSPDFDCNAFFPAADSVRFRTFNVSNPYGSWAQKEYISAGTYLRFLMPELVFPHADKVLYLDADIIVNCDLSALFSTDLRQKPLAAMADYGLVLGSEHWVDYRVKYDGKSYRFNDYTRDVLGLGYLDYLNAGVLLVDASLWENISARAIRFLQDHPTLPFLDQDALSHIVGGNFVRLDPRYNSFSYLAFPDGRSLPEKIRGLARKYHAVRRAWLKDPKIIHFAGSNKPWLEHAEATALERYWWHYAKRSPARDRYAHFEHKKLSQRIEKRKY